VGWRAAGQAAAGATPRVKSQGRPGSPAQPGATHRRQHTPDGATYTARKKRKDLHGKKDRIKRQNAAMFEKLRMTKNLKTQQDEKRITVGFFGRVARIARVHQEGLKEKLSKKGPEHQYPAQPLLGFSATDQALIRDSLLRHLNMF
jgi:phage virion morphogenesis protein